MIVLLHVCLYEVDHVKLEKEREVKIRAQLLLFGFLDEKTMFSKAKYWMGIGKPKNQHSLENLKYLYAVLNKNQIVTENNKDLLIETLRSISEILIWGDQNDSSVFE